MTARIERLVTSGTFELDGVSSEVDNNVWLVGVDDEVLVIDAAHAPDLIAVVCSHAHSDHEGAAPDLAARHGAPILLRPADAVLWKTVHGMRVPGFWELIDGEDLTVAGTELQVLHTPGHSPGSVCLYAPEPGAVFSGDTLFQSGPGATGRSFSDFGTTIGAEAPRLDEWIARGH
ncbi:MBL fold metallo-hydrolase [Streptomyces sp. NPDC014995]|uniref:MBL fold metallo-hydrolase n=1 Tax=Streptomyces sp. NPDC014995 TaxID=3364936 RepID=UPI0036F95D13